MRFWLRQYLLPWSLALALVASTLNSRGLAQEKPPPSLPETTVVGELIEETAPAPSGGLVRPTGRLPLLIPTPQRPTFGLPNPNGVENVVGAPVASSQGQIDAQLIQYQVRSRPGEVLQLVPGLIVTQHSGTGKANQFFLRGFNLDHGTDFSAWLDDVPINLPTHAHGQGYLDVNFLIPELIQTIDFYKGPYYAQLGDFSSVGSAWMNYVDRLDAGFTSITAGRVDWFRALSADSGQVGPGILLYAIDTTYYNGPWVLPEDFRKFSGLIKYTIDSGDDGLSISLLGYNAKWTATDQIPQRAVDEKLISRLGFVDPFDGGTTSRGILNAQWWHRGVDGQMTRANVYGVLYSLNLYNDFTYFLDDPVNGDQFEQVDRRYYTGFNLSHTWNDWFIGQRLVHTVGLQTRNDYLPRIELNHTRARQRLSTVSAYEVDEFNIGLFYYNQVQWMDKVRTQVGLRGDRFYFETKDQNIPENSGSKNAGILNPKGSLILGPWAKTDFYLSAGQSYHSNDARGVTLRIDPVTGEPADSAIPLVRTQGWETGIRTQAIPRLTSTVTFWALDIASELLFVGDAGNTEASRPSRRYGVEYNNSYQLAPWLRIEANYAWSHARFSEFAPEGNFIPGSIESAFYGGPTVTLPCGLFLTGQYRYFGPRPLIEDGSVFSKQTSVVDMTVGYQRQRMTCGIMFLNLLNSQDHDIDYYYASRLPLEPAGGVEDIHFHPLEPFAMRFYMQVNY